MGETRQDSNWVLTGFSNALEARRRVERFLEAHAFPGLSPLGVMLTSPLSPAGAPAVPGAGTVTVILDSVLRWTSPSSTRSTGAEPGETDQITTALLEAFPSCGVYYTNDLVGSDLAAGDITIEAAYAAGDATRAPY